MFLVVYFVDFLLRDTHYFLLSYIYHSFHLFIPFYFCLLFIYSWHMLLKYSALHENYNDKYVIIIYVYFLRKSWQLKVCNYKTETTNPWQNKIVASIVSLSIPKRFL